MGLASVIWLGWNISEEQRHERAYWDGPCGFTTISTVHMLPTVVRSLFWRKHSWEGAFRTSKGVSRILLHEIEKSTQRAVALTRKIPWTGLNKTRCYALWHEHMSHEWTLLSNVGFKGRVRLVRYRGSEKPFDKDCTCNRAAPLVEGVQYIYIVQRFIL